MVTVPATPGYPADRPVVQEYLGASNDTRATPYLNRMTQQPARYGASTHSDLVGFPTTAREGIGRTTTHYIQHVRYLGFRGADAARRRAWLDEPGGWARAPPHLRAVAHQGPPALKTRDEVVRRMRAGDRAPQGNLAVEDRGYHGTGAMTANLPGWDASRQYFDCTGHALKNNSAQATQLMANLGTMKYTYVFLSY